MFVPKLVSTLRTYDRAQFRSDASAGVIVGIVALPLAIAFAIASGVSPDRGLWTAIVAGFLILIIMGLAKFGDAIAFIPHPLVTGFTSGIALIIFMRRMASVASTANVTTALEASLGDEAEAPLLDRRMIPAGVEVYEINGPFFFGAAQAFKDTIGRVSGKPKVLIIRMRHVPVLDSTGMRSLRDVVHRTRKDGTVVILAEAQSQPLAALSNSVTITEIGERNVVPSLEAAIARATEAIAGRPSQVAGLRAIE